MYELAALGTARRLNRYVWLVVSEWFTAYCLDLRITAAKLANGYSSWCPDLSAKSLGSSYV